MHRLLVIIMIVLLPLRGWAGDLMSFQMAASSAVAHVADDMPPACPMHAQTDQAQTNHAQPDMKNCASCGLCIPLADLAFSRFDLVTATKDTQPLFGTANFASALVAPTAKPPIF